MTLRFSALVIASFSLFLFACGGGKKTANVEPQANAEKQELASDKENVSKEVKQSEKAKDKVALEKKEQQADEGPIPEGLSLLEPPDDLERIIADAKQQQAKTISPSTRKVAKRAEGQYMTIKFQQNDTEVEMALDPQAGNLNLDLMRSPNGFLEVAKGDSVIYERGNRPAPKSREDFLSQNEPKPMQPLKGLESEDLTDDIIRDINLAQKMFYERKYDQALQVLQQSLQRKRTATAYALGGSIYYVNGEIDEAVSAWENALKINPNLDDVRELVLRYKN